MKNICWSGKTNNNQIRSQFCTCLDSSAVMACAKLWPHWITEFKITALHFSHWQDFNYDFIKSLWNDTLPKVINSECHVLASVALIIVSCQPLVCFHRFMNKCFGGGPTVHQENKQKLIIYYSFILFSFLLLFIYFIFIFATNQNFSDH